MKFNSSNTSEKTYDDRLLTIGQAAEVIGLPTWQLRRAVKRGIVPSYAPFNSRRLVYLSEIRAFIAATRRGGDHA